MSFVSDFFRDISDFLEAGGPIVMVLLWVALVLWFMIFERFIFYRTELPKLIASVRQQWDSREEHTSWYAVMIRQQLIAETQRKIRGSLPLIKTLIALCPLVGLLGTVTGMILVFEVMAVLGTGNAREMAGGVSAATLPTLAGMVLALSGMYPLVRFEHITQRETRMLRDYMIRH
jgi:biopolymer transport protein ExbB